MINIDERHFTENYRVHPKNTVRGQEVKIEGETFYKISNVDGMRPFFMSLVIWEIFKNNTDLIC